MVLDEETLRRLVGLQTDLQRALFTLAGLNGGFFSAGTIALPNGLAPTGFTNQFSALTNRFAAPLTNRFFSPLTNRFSAPAAPF